MPYSLYQHSSPYYLIAHYRKLSNIILTGGMVLLAGPCAHLPQCAWPSRKVLRSFMRLLGSQVSPRKVGRDQVALGSGLLAVEPRCERDSPVALVPDPAVASCLGPEVSSAQIVDLGGEA